MDAEVLNSETFETPDLSICQADLERYAPGMAKTINLGIPVRNDWSDGTQERHIGDLYEQFLQAVQLAKDFDDRVAKHVGRSVRKYDRNTTFEQYLEDCLATQRWQLEWKIPDEFSRGLTGVSGRDNARDTAEESIRAIRKYLEGTAKERLVGVPEPGF